MAGLMGDMNAPSAPRPTDEDLLQELRRLLAARGKLTASLIEASEITRAPNTYIRRFGSLVAAYDLIGYGVSARQRATSERFATRTGAGRQADGICRRAT